jgi:hypothetical protein
MGDEGLHSVAYRRAVPAQHHIDCPALVAGTDKLLTPIKTHRLGAMLPGRLDKIGPMAAPPSTKRSTAARPLGPFSRKLVAPGAGSSGALQHVADGFSRWAISPCGLNENAPVWLCLRLQRSSQPPPHRQARSPLAKRRQGSQLQPPPTSRQGGLLAKNSGAFYSPPPRRDTFLRETSEMIVISLHDFLRRIFTIFNDYTKIW